MNPAQALRTGLLGLAVPLLWKPVGHTVVVLFHAYVHGPARFMIAMFLGSVGVALVWLGLKRDELSATCLGFVGGTMIWIGWFEHGFEFFGEFLHVPGLGFLTPNLLLMEASVAMLVALLIFLAANKDTRCRMFMWIHRTLRVRPNKPTPGYRRQYACIAAMETVFVTWFFYVLIVLLLDPRIFGPTHPVTYGVSLAILLWALYLVIFKVPEQGSIAQAIRYGIPTAGVIWYSFEITAAWGWYREPWIRPFDFPIIDAFIGVAFLTAFTVAARQTRRGAKEYP